MSKEMSEEELYSISTPTCFVCMLHLCNENNLFVNQKDINTFYVQKDINGEKSAQTLSQKKSDDITKPKIRKRKAKKKESYSDNNSNDEMEINED